jgi:hypothetical protein
MNNIKIKNNESKINKRNKKCPNCKFCEVHQKIVLCKLCSDIKKLEALYRL